MTSRLGTNGRSEDIGMLTTIVEKTDADAGYTRENAVNLPVGTTAIQARQCYCSH
jgi:hypothetical protein